MPGKPDQFPLIEFHHAAQARKYDGLVWSLPAASLSPLLTLVSYNKRVSVVSWRPMYIGSSAY